MASQNNSGRQYNKVHALTIVTAAAVLAHRFIAYDGDYATSAGGVHDAQGVSEFDAKAGTALSIVTSYSYLVEAEKNIAFGDFVKPGMDGRAVIGTATECCGRALGDAIAGNVVEVQLLAHRHAVVKP